MEETGTRFLLLSVASVSFLCFLCVRASTKVGCVSCALFVTQSPHGQRVGRKAQVDPDPPSYPVYELLSAREVAQLMLQWKSDYPEFVNITTAQAQYGLARPGTRTDCPFDEGGDGCLTYIATIQDFTLHPRDSESSRRLPEVFWSGSVHGNERVGPTATIHAAWLLLQAASCQRRISRAQGDHTECQAKLEAQGINNVQREWLSRLVSTRRIVYLPTANPMGYFRNRRFETIAAESENESAVGIDPNTDFPYDTDERNPTRCMRSITARAINEVYRDHLFQIGLTFHAGVGPLIGFEWGNPAYLGYLSPDDTAQATIAAAFSRYGGSFRATPEYQVTTMNAENMFLHGAMEDWAYAASFDAPLVTQCNTSTYGGYSVEKTIYNNSTLRSFTMLIETSLQGRPSELGTGFDVLNKDSADNGHVSRNVRLALSSLDLVEPYVAIISVDNVETADDITARARPNDRLGCQQMKRMHVPVDSSSVDVRWTVGGALEIDETSLWYGKWDLIPSTSWNCMEQPSDQTSSLITSLLVSGSDQNAMNGTGYFSGGGASPLGLPGESLGPVFQSSVDLSHFSEGDEVVVLALARVDQSWTEQPEDDLFRPRLPPQSHVVNARTDPNWYHESAGVIVQGRLDWFTIVPLTLVMAPVDTVSPARSSGASKWVVQLASIQSSVLAMLLTLQFG